MMRKCLRSPSPNIFFCYKKAISYSTSTDNKPFQKLQAPFSANDTTLPVIPPASFIVSMKIFTILTASTSLFGVFASAAPLSSLDTRAFPVFVNFYGADEGTSFFQSFPANEGPVKISRFFLKSPTSQP